MSIKFPWLRILLSLPILILISCTGEEHVTNYIVGKWRPVEKYQDDLLQEMTACEMNIYREYTAAGMQTGDEIERGLVENTCYTVRVLRWQHIGSDLYHIIQEDNHPEMWTIYREQDRLIEINAWNTKRVYVPL